MSIKQSLNQLETLFSGVSEPEIPVAPRAKARRVSDSGTAPSGWVWEFDADGNSLWCSDEIQPLLGLRPSQIHGQTLEFCGLVPDFGPAIARRDRRRRTDRQLVSLRHASQRFSDHAAA